MYQDNGAPRGYGQQRGRSPYLDREANNVAEALVGEPQYESPVSRTMPVGERYEVPEEGGEDRSYARPQVQDRWGRSPSHPHYGQDPRYLGMSKDDVLKQAKFEKTSRDVFGSASQSSGDSLYGEKRLTNDAFKPGSVDYIRGLLGEEPENADGTFSNYQLSRISGNRQGSAGGMAPEYEDFQWEIAGREANKPYGSTADDTTPQTPSSQGSGGMPQGSMWSQDYRFLGGEGLPDVMNLQVGDTSRLRGFATDQWGPGGDPNYDEDSIKNAFGKIASRYDPTQPGAARAVMEDPEFKALFPNARLVEHPKADQIDFGDGNPVDVLINAVEGGAGEAWAFQTGGGEAMVGGGAPLSGGSGAAPGGGPSPNAVNNALVGPTVNANDSTLQALLQQILLGNSEGQAMYNAYQELI